MKTMCRASVLLVIGLLSLVIAAVQQASASPAPPQYSAALDAAQAAARKQNSVTKRTDAAAKANQDAAARPGNAPPSPQAATASQGQQPQAATAPQPAKPSPASQGSPMPPNEPTGFTYSAEDRRDPFVSLLRRGRDTRGSATSVRPVGLAGLSAGEVTLRGTVRSQEGYVAIVQGADQKTYIVRAGDKLFDGTIRTVTQNDMVIVQQVNDPLSLDKQREVRKVLRQTEAN